MIIFIGFAFRRSHPKAGATCAIPFTAKSDSLPTSLTSLNNNLIKITVDNVKTADASDSIFEMSTLNTKAINTFLSNPLIYFD
jgi:hypothetical protein